jgi:hypothetical protein
MQACRNDTIDFIIEKSLGLVRFTAVAAKLKFDPAVVASAAVITIVDSSRLLVYFFGTAMICQISEH